MKVWHPWQLKKSKSWGPFWSYQLNSTANQANLAQFFILIFSIVLGAEYSFYVKSIAIYAPTFFGYNNSVLAIVPYHEASASNARNIKIVPQIKHMQS